MRSFSLEVSGNFHADFEVRGIIRIKEETPSNSLAHQKVKKKTNGKQFQNTLLWSRLSCRTKTGAKAGLSQSKTPFTAIHYFCPPLRCECPQFTKHTFWEKKTFLWSWLFINFWQKMLELNIFDKYNRSDPKGIQHQWTKTRLNNINW